MQKKRSRTVRQGFMETNNLLDLPFDEIASWFPRGLTAWLKRSHPDKWSEFLSIEKELNRASFELNESRTEELLIQYRDFVRAMTQEFESRKNGRGKGFDHR